MAVQFENDHTDEAPVPQEGDKGAGLSAQVTDMRLAEMVARGAAVALVPGLEAAAAGVRTGAKVGAAMARVLGEFALNMGSETVENAAEKPMDKGKEGEVGERAADGKQREMSVEKAIDLITDGYKDGESEQKDRQLLSILLSAAINHGSAKGESGKEVQKIVDALNAAMKAKGVDVHFDLKDSEALTKEANAEAQRKGGVVTVCKELHITKGKELKEVASVVAIKPVRRAPRATDSDVA